MAWRQQKDKPLFEDLLWSRPENKRHAGKLLVVGGQAGQFAHVSSAYAAAGKAGAGHIRVLLPDSLTKLTLGLPGVEYAQANSIGSFSKSSLADLMELSGWADHVLLAGDFGKNSETTIMLESFLGKSNTPITISPNTIGSLGEGAYNKIARLNIYAVLDFAQLQKLGSRVGLHEAITSTLPINLLAERLAEITSMSPVKISGNFNGLLWAAENGEAISTHKSATSDMGLAGYISVWVMQNPSKPLEAMATACWEV